jgi:hypothetical protein
MTLNWLQIPFRLVELIGIDAIFKRELKVLEGTFENDEVVEM